jgi:hypothetical protein
MVVRGSRAAGFVAWIFLTVFVAGAALAQEGDGDSACDQACIATEDECFRACPEGDGEDECGEVCSQSANQCFEECETDD